ncbi:MAG: class A beta-lactamase-related serine hydrolase [Bacteroidetes bacterium]|nr:MAG: class A beta-lactamase-related serine hydrolase [Bacteroidota bacterium]
MPPESCFNGTNTQCESLIIRDLLPTNTCHMNKLYTLVLLLILTSGFVKANNNHEEQLQEIVTTNNLMGMSVVAVHEGKIIYSGHFGLSNFATGIQVTNRTLYRIASISKTITAMAFMQLHEQGLVNLDDDISDIMEYPILNPHHQGTAITPRMLLSHTSTLNDGSTYSSFLSTTYNNPTPPNINQLIVPGGSHFSNNIWINATPGEHFQYSNLGYGVLGSIIEKISGERFDVYVRENILEPLEINGSFNIHDITSVTNLAVLYRMSCDQWVPQADNYPSGLPDPIDYSGYEPGHNGLIFSPQGGLRITAEDLAKIMITLSGKGTYNEIQLLQEETVELMLQRHWQFNGNNGNNYYNLFNAWGLGMHLITNQENGDIVVPGYEMKGHAGEAYGLISDMYYNNDPDFGIIFITNGSAGAYFGGWNSAFYEVEEQIFSLLYNSLIAPEMVETHDVNIVVEGMGTTQPSPGTYTMEAGEIFNISAHAEEGWIFEHYIINGETISQPAYQLPVESSVQITAVFAEIPTSTGTLLHDNQPRVFVNHNDHLLTIDFGNQQTYYTGIRLYNLKGELVLQEKVTRQTTGNRKTIDVSFLPPGTYITILNATNSEPITGKVTIL